MFFGAAYYLDPRYVDDTFDEEAYKVFINATNIIHSPNERAARYARDQFDLHKNMQGSTFEIQKRIGDRSASPPDSSLTWGSSGYSGWI